MKYGVKYQNYLKGNFGVFLFPKKQQAERAFSLLDELWGKGFNSEAEYTESYDIALENCIACEDEFSRKDLQILNKCFPYSVNNAGHVSIVRENMRLVNEGDYVQIPA